MKIITYPNPILEKRAKKVKDPLASETQNLVKKMIKIMQEAEGAGLAAPQIGESLRICTIQEGGKIYVLINPQITTYSREKEICEEGCLSFPGKYIPVKRARKIKVRFTDQLGEKIKLKAEDLLARIIQHEVDHLDGKLFINKK